MKILFVAFPFSIHTVRWLNQLAGSGFELHLYSSHRGALPHAQLSEEIVYHSNPLSLKKERTLFDKVADRIKTPVNKSSSEELNVLITHIQPDIIHSLESQHAGYLVSKVKENFRGKMFPFWIHSNWGIDLHFFGKLNDHQAPLKKMLLQIDLLIVEGERDSVLAREFGYVQHVEIFPSVGGGFLTPVLKSVAPSQRSKILIKGTQDIVRRGLCAIRALERCTDVLNGYEILLYNSCIETRIAAELFKANTGKEIKIIKECAHNAMLELTAASRISICTNMSDGLPNSMLEAMMLGAFPIQSDTCISEGWINNGRNGFLVPPEDTDLIAAQIRMALGNDVLVDEAVPLNAAIISERLNYFTMQEAALKMYSTANS